MSTHYVMITNLDDSSVLVKSCFNPDWMLVSPDEFKLLPKKTRRIMVVFFIPYREDIARQGEIVFETKKDKRNQARIGVDISDSVVRREEKEKDSEPVQNTKNKKEIEGLREEVNRLEKNIQEKEQRINDLSKYTREKMVEKLMPLYTYLFKNLREEINNNEVRLEWIGDKLSIVIQGQNAQDLPVVNVKEKNMIETLEKVGIVVDKKADSDNQIKVRGYAINSRLRNKFPSNWEIQKDQLDGEKIRIMVSALEERKVSQEEDVKKEETKKEAVSVTDSFE